MTAQDLFPMDEIRKRREAREIELGPMLDGMAPNELEGLCNYVFPQWPMVFGKPFTVETARQDTVLRWMLLFALDDSASKTAA